MSASDKIVFFDLETSGLDKAQHAIVQIGAIAFEVPEFKMVESFSINIKFRAETASPAALAVNSVARDQFGGQDWPDTMEEMPANSRGDLMELCTQWNTTAVHPLEAERQFSRFLKRHATVGKVSKRGGMYYVAQLAGHNVMEFDVPFLREWYKKLGQFMPANWFALDTLNMALANMALGGIQYADLKLETLLKHHGLADQQEHDAISDIRQTAALCQMLYRQVRFDNEIEAKLNEAAEKAQGILDSVQDSPF